MGHRNDIGLVTSPILAGVERLWAHKSLTINGVTVEPSAFIAGVDYNGTTWACRATGKVLALGAGTSAPVSSPAPMLGDKEVVFGGAGDKLFTAPDNDWFDIGTEDFLVEYTGIFGTAGGTVIRRQTGVAYVTIYENPNWLNVQVNDGVDSFQLQSGFGVLEVGTRLHMFAAVNRNEASANGAKMWVNATQRGALDPSAVGDLSLAFASRIGGSHTDTCGTAQIGSLALWKRADWIAAGAGGINEVAAIAKARASLYFGQTARASHADKTPLVL